MDNDYKFGEIVAEVKNLKYEINYLRGDIKELRENLVVLKQWRSQIIGISLAISALTSIFFSVLSVLSLKWP